jgi:DNA (cytosine-5)-methyltransferase 1
LEAVVHIQSDDRVHSSRSECALQTHHDWTTQSTTTGRRTKTNAVETFTKAKRAQTTTDDETWVEGKPAPTLNSFDQGDTRATTVVAFATNQRAEVRELDDKAVALSAEPGTNQQTYIAFENSYRDGVRIATEDVSQTLSAKMGSGGNNTPMVAQAIPIQDGRDIEKHQNGIGIGEEGAPSYTLDQTGAQAVAYAFDSLSSNSMKSSNPNSGVRVTEIAKTLDTARPDPSCNQGGIAITQPVTYGIQGNVIGRQDHNGPGGKGHTEEGDPMFTLTGTDIHAVATLLTMREGKEGGGKGPLISEGKSLSLSTSNEQTLFQPNVAIQYDGYNQKINDTDIAQTLRLGRDSSDFVAQPVEPVMLNMQGSKGNSATTEDGISYSLNAMHGHDVHAITVPTMAVRRLTPIECERLMGWPDGWTEGQADTHRYKQCGNGVASPVATWIAQQLLQLDKEPDAPPTTTTT